MEEMGSFMSDDERKRPATQGWTLSSTGGMNLASSEIVGDRGGGAGSLRGRPARGADRAQTRAQGRARGAKEHDRGVQRRAGGAGAPPGGRGRILRRRPAAVALANRWAPSSLSSWSWVWVGRCCSRASGRRPTPVSWPRRKRRRRQPRSRQRRRRRPFSRRRRRRPRPPRPRRRPPRLVRRRRTKRLPIQPATIPPGPRPRRGRPGRRSAPSPGIRNTRAPAAARPAPTGPRRRSAR